MGTTPIMGIPFPESTDPVANGAQNMEDLATTVDNKTGLVYVTETSFVNAPYVQIDGCFPNDASDFVMAWQIKTSAASDYFYRFTGGGTPISSNYYWARQYVYSTAGAGSGTTYGDLIGYGYLGTSLAWGSAGTAEISIGATDPFGSGSWSRTLSSESSTGNNGTPYGFINRAGTGQIGSSAIDGIYISSLGAATITGKIKIYKRREN